MLPVVFGMTLALECLSSPPARARVCVCVCEQRTGLVMMVHASGGGHGYGGMGMGMGMGWQVHESMHIHLIPSSMYRPVYGWIGMGMGMGTGMERKLENGIGIFPRNRVYSRWMGWD